MSTSVGTTTSWLTETLAAGAMESARVKALAEQRGIGPKALRNAREALGVVATRHGAGATMRSMWALPDAAHVASQERDGSAPDGAQGIRAPAEPAFVPPSRPEPTLLRNPKVSGEPDSLQGALITTMKADVEATSGGSNLLRNAKGFQGAADQQAPRLLRFVKVKQALAPLLDDNERRRVERRIELFVQRGLGQYEARQVAVALIQRDRGSGQAVGSCIECQNYVRQQCSEPQLPVLIHECWSRRHDAP